MDVRAIYEELSTIPSLRPSQALNALFAQLVHIAISPEAREHQLSREEIDRLQALCGAGEYELERFGAEEILRTDNPHAALRCFPYFQNYVALTEHE